MISATDNKEDNWKNGHFQLLHKNLNFNAENKVINVYLRWSNKYFWIENLGLYSEGHIPS